MTPHDPHAVCRQCGRAPAEGKTDAVGWCDECRAGVVRRATPVAYAVAGAFSVAYLLALWWTGALQSTNFVVFWLALGALLAFGTYKVARRVAFDVIRSRTARSPG
ncbi:MAG TPA: hypothetical protein VFQ76_13610 [Longimicrobiaceae bacterium]|nr:hypothetical protein [Longimicrobiaceae bacterium]